MAVGTLSAVWEYKTSAVKDGPACGVGSRLYTWLNPGLSSGQP